jgi:hypothetical protein
VALLPDGAIIVARDIRRGIVMERLTPEGAVPFLRVPLFNALGHDYEDLSLTGAALGGHPAVFARIEQPDRNAHVLGLWSERGGLLMQRVLGPVLSLTATGFGEGAVVVATTEDIGVREDFNVGGAELYLVGGPDSPRHALLEGVRAYDATIAATADRIAVAYVTQRGLRSAVVDQELTRLGDVLAVSPDTAAPAVAFAGSRVLVFFVHDEAGKRRLTVASYAPGEAAIGAPKVAVEEAVLSNPPVTARLPNGTFVVMWVATAGGVAKLRASTIGPEGALTGPTTLASGATFARLTATSSDLGINLVWRESATSTRVARVSCVP